MEHFNHILRKTHLHKLQKRKPIKWNFIHDYTLSNRNEGGFTSQRHVPVSKETGSHGSEAWHTLTFVTHQVWDLHAVIYN
jgi:hypothetical protein